MKNKYILLGLFLFLLTSQIVLTSRMVQAALDFDGELTAEEEDAFDAILAPVMKVYQFIKYAATIIGVLMLVFAGISFATSGGDNAQKERAKNTAAGVIIGLILIWVAPLIVEYLLS